MHKRNLLFFVYGRKEQEASVQTCHSIKEVSYDRKLSNSGFLKKRNSQNQP